MRKLVSVFLMVACLFSVTRVTYAQSVTAANIFSSLGGDTTISQGGVIHSQARTIYSLGGGMVSFKGKNVSLLSADPPSFSAGCTGVSWHFGGFAFISLDQIRQLVEAVAQASLGVVVDLAMQTLCPQCYAVMSKLRDLASMMRNAAANSCRIAEMLGNEMKDGISSALGNQGLCGSTSASDGSDDSFLGSLAAGACSTLSNVNTGLGNISSKVNSFLSGSGSGSSTPTKEQLNMEGNMTYEALSALGYQDGFLKDVMLSITGMAVHTLNPAPDCSQVFASLSASSSSSSMQSNADSVTLTNSTTMQKGLGGVAYSASGSAYSSLLGGVNALLTTMPADAIQSTGGSNVSATPAMSQFTTAATPNAGDTNQGTNTCFAPPLLTGFGDVARTLICGINPSADAQTFVNRNGVNIDQFENSPVWAMCMAVSQNGTYNGPSTAAANPMLYHCSASDSNRCMNPTYKTFQDDSNAQSNGLYTGLAWMVLDALYQGTIAVANNTGWPAETLAIVNGSDYPLYRIINLSAVYPGMAGDLLNAYGSVIAVQYAVDTLDKLGSPGALPGIDLRAAHGGLSEKEVRTLHEQLMNMIHDAGPLKDEVLKRLNEKRALVDTIVQVNRALQADVLSQGLGGNANLAMSIKDQLSHVTPAH